jgi:hypothetical protein
LHCSARSPLLALLLLRVLLAGLLAVLLLLLLWGHLRQAFRQQQPVLACLGFSNVPAAAAAAVLAGGLLGFLWLICRRPWGM